MQGLERWELIYDQINGMLVPGVCGWAKDETSEDGELGPLVKRAYEARDRIAGRLGIDPGNDEDFQQLVDGFEEFSRACGKLMYHYGCQDGTRAK